MVVVIINRYYYDAQHTKGPDFTMDFAYTISGFVVGFIVGLTGVGGGSLMTPILVLLFGINPAIAIGNR